MTNIKISHPDPVKEKILQSFFNQWINPELEKDLLELSHNITMFNEKWGTEIKAEDVLPNTQPNNPLEEIANDWKKQAQDLSETHEMKITQPNNPN